MDSFFIHGLIFYMFWGYYRMKRILTLIMALGLGSPVFAQDIYKCTSSGETGYQSKPCKEKGELISGLRHHKTQSPATAYTLADEQQEAESYTSNAVPDTVEGKKKSLAIAQDAYRMTKERN
jgi:hypothetical protein